MSQISKDPDYNKKYYIENRSKWYEYEDCKICGSRYNRSTKYNHFKSMKHKKCEQIMKEKDDKIKELEKELYKEN
ncbi:hypothetical protein QKU48_gp1159 [Fadolivirus algeromassiliense]|jgi:hypothetical protein|uniref:Uncharacterized protein n=1 Tax=Fadolivirus FV1/VV64 TaxID=3070911 RepID=A0A7D3V952_9VIRU|nr:hypothetical protein QKU48_gp1159 [Fadolivirus algeromassiliense]QKF94617.1 hypothetical protein Fadolivirus_1_1159 [Fadolivirus FV1/VV64]